MDLATTRLLTMADIEKLSNFCRHTITAKVARGEFPAPLKLSDGPKARLGWTVADWEAWVESRRSPGAAAPSLAAMLLSPATTPRGRRP